MGMRSVSAISSRHERATTPKTKPVLVKQSFFSAVGVWICRTADFFFLYMAKACDLLKTTMWSSLDRFREQFQKCTKQSMCCRGTCTQRSDELFGACATLEGHIGSHRVTLCDGGPNFLCGCARFSHLHVGCGSILWWLVLREAEN